MQIEQYQRRETPTGSAGNVISRQPNSYAELGRLGQTITDVGFAMEEQRLQAQYHDQFNKAKLDVDKRFLEHEESLDPNNTDQWEADTETLQKGYDEILSKISNGKARDDASTWLEQEKLRQKSAISSYRRQTDARNFSANYQVNYKQSMEIASKQPTPGEYDQSRLSSMRSLFQVEPIDPEKPIGKDNLKVIEGADNPLFHTDKLRLSQARAWLVGTEEIYEQNQKDALSERIISEALAMAPEQAISYLDAANEVASRGYGLKENFFDSKELAALKQDYRAQKNIAEGEKNDRAEVFDRDTRKKILAGGTLLPTLRDEILNNPDLSGPQINTLINLYDSRVDGAGKKYSNQEKLAAYAEIVEEKDPAKKLELLFKHAGAFTPEKAQSLYDSIANPTTKDFEDSDVAKDLKGLVDSLSFIEEPQKFVLTSKGYGLLREVIESAEEPLDLTQKKMKVLEIFNMLEKEANELSLEQISPEEILTPRQKAKGAGVRMALAAGASILVQGELAKIGKAFESSEPKTVDDFKETVRRLAQTDRSRAKAYYDKWASKWQ